jgi:tRNA-2-methylthio-N6-dimethylallyladenosine synthase
VSKVYLRTFGCQMNEYDSDRISDVLRESHGMEAAERPEDADLIVFNTCSVREKAQEKVFADLGRVKHLKRDKPGLMIAVGGCVASQEGGSIVEARALRRRGVRAADAAPGCRSCWSAAAHPDGRRWT